MLQLWTSPNFCCLIKELNNKFLDRTKLKAFTDDEFKIAKIMISVLEKLDRVENIVEKGENTSNQHFPQCLQKASSSG